jgi:hypothetical protein
MLRPSRSIDHAATMSISRAVTALSSRSKAGRLSRPLVPLMPLSSKTSNTSQPDRLATASSSRRWFSVVCQLVVDTRSKPQLSLASLSYPRQMEAAIRNQVVCVWLFEGRRTIESWRF